jgi:protein-S-isoprenylcysteine O-methyltransferase Ste14
MLPGLDKRFGWSNVPPLVVFLADGLVLFGYSLFFWVMRTNSYASRIVQVTAGQQVISTGPYAIIRHPMYFSTLLIYPFSPLALGSYWAMLPTFIIIILLVARILNEEEVLVRDLPGYAEYRQKVKYRLIPGIW